VDVVAALTDCGGPVIATAIHDGPPDTVSPEPSERVTTISGRSRAALASQAPSGLKATARSSILDLESSDVPLMAHYLSNHVSVAYGDIYDEIVALSQELAFRVRLLDARTWTTARVAAAQIGQAARAARLQSLL
jgi:hypothetical protein